MTDLELLIDKVAYQILDIDLPTEDILLEQVRVTANILRASHKKEYTNEDIFNAVRILQTRHVHRMKIGALFEAEYLPWLAGRQGDIDWYYWERYRKQLLVSKGFSPHVVRTLDELTDKVLDRLADPSSEGEWRRQGMVVGHVQSGKTANYTGLVCKAADAGYQVIIVLAGLLNSLRNQTQERLDTDFMGWCTRLRDFAGASKFGKEKPRPVCFTTSAEDFKKSAANTIAMGLDAINVPVLFVLKKNKSTLENLYQWLSDHNKHNLREFSMLMIDDEADNASVNTNKDDLNPTAINKAIRDLLSLFSRSSYVGYTATPFANIFIDPENENEMQNGERYRDLFPKDFILSLEPPDNYVGPQRIFDDDSDLNIVRFIEDNEELLPIRHKIDFVPIALPKSLKNAINSFIIAKTIRILRGQEGKHNSMMINVSRFTDVQMFLKGIVLEHIKQIRQSVRNYAALNSNDALKNRDIDSLYSTWKQEFTEATPSWEDIQSHLKSAVDPIEVLGINSRSNDVLDYSSVQYPNGRTVIAVGGLGLSRGLTLEGLIVSYFLRNSIMYDTLMQMGRWFGYRDGYADLCRIYMTPDTFAWYSHIADSTEELRDDFKAMEKAKLTPMEFGLRVRSHPTALIVTARNKMRASRDIPVNICLDGRLAETSVVYSDPKCLHNNSIVLQSTLAEASQHGSPDEIPLGYFWRNVPSRIVRSAIGNYQNHPECMLTYSEPLIDYLNQLVDLGINTCDILLRSVQSESDYLELNSLKVCLPQRNVAVFDDARIEFSKRRVASKGDEKAGLSNSVVLEIERQFGSKNVPDREYRKYRWYNKMPPLFMVNFIRAKTKEDSRNAIVPCFSLSFPGDPGNARLPIKTVQYRVNTVWWKKNYINLQEEDPDE